MTSPSAPVSAPPLPRDQFAVAERWTYLNHATICAPPRSVIDAAHAFNVDAGGTGAMGFLDRVASVQSVRGRAARLMGVEPERVALMPNTTHGLTTIASGLRWTAGDRVLLAAGDFPSTRGPFLALRRLGVQVDEVPPDPGAGAVTLDQWSAALTAGEGRVRVVATSWIGSNSGHRTDLASLAELCHRHGALLVADVIQGLGVVPCWLDEWGVDAAAGGSHKWLLAPEGVGVLALSDELVDRLDVAADGWRWSGTEATEKAYTAAAPATAARFEGGTLNGSGLAGLDAGMAMLEHAGIGAVWSWVDRLCEHLCAEVASAGWRVRSDRSPDARSAIVLVDLPAGRDAQVVAGALADAGIVVTARSGALRISPHAWNTHDEIDQLIEALGALV